MSIDINALSFKSLSIHQLVPRKGIFPTQEKTEKFIHRILKKYNDDQEQEKNTFKTAPLTKWEINQHNNFHAQVYFSKRPNETNFARWVTSMSDSASKEFENVSVHFIFFLYRQINLQTKAKEKTKTQWELFALTTEDAFHVVKTYSSFQFPIKVALRIIDPHLSAAEKKPLAGHTDSAAETYRTEYSLLQNEMETVWKWFKGFHSHFKLDSSIYNPAYNLTDFTIKKSNATHNKIAVHISVGKISVDKALTMSQYERILMYFSLIANGGTTLKLEKDKSNDKTKKTKVIETPEVDDAAIRSLENIQPVEQQLVPQLDQALWSLVWKCLDPKQSMGGLSFVHRFYRDFYNSGTFTLQYENKIILEWNYKPSITEIMESLRMIYGQVKEYKSFFQMLENTKFKFDKKPVFYPIKQFFQGELRYGDEVYFRIDQIWLKVNADQLIILQRDFFNLLQDNLLKNSDLLSKPWIAKTEWAGFSVEQMTKVTGMAQDKVKTYLDDLTEEKFAFLDDEGLVLSNYPTRCILDEGGGYVKLLKKRWDRFTNLLAERSKGKKAVTQKDLITLLTTKKENKQIKQWALNLLNSLKKERPILLKLPSSKVKKISLLDANHIPRFPDMSNFKFTSTALTTHTVAINALLKARYDKKKPLTKKDLENLKDKEGKKGKTIHKGSANTLFNQFCKPVKVSGDAFLLTNRYLAQGPIPKLEKGSSGNTKMRGFLENRFDDYKKVFEEEGYNRLYLKEEGFFVGDQSYAGKQEKVELFDIMHFGKGQDVPLSLIHVKEGFGQKTREACAQIRVAAVNIDNALKFKNGEMLRQFYNKTAKSSEGASPFRKELQKKLKANFKNEDAFVKLFQDKGPKGIQFVYAFIDDAEQERLLENESNPSRVFTDKDFLSFAKNDQEEAKKLFKTLHDKKYMDKHGRLTADFVRSTIDQFKTNFGGSNALPIYTFLISQISKFDSLVAKIELIELKKFLIQLGFPFKVCQIRRSSLQNDQDDNLSGWYDLSQSEWEAAPTTALASFEYDKIKYDIQKKPLNDQEMVATLLKVNPKDLKSLGVAFYKLLNEHKKAKEVTDFLNKKSIYEYILKDKFDKKDWLLIAHLLKTKITLFSMSSKSKTTVDVDKPEVINKSGKTSLLFLQQKDLYLRCIAPKEDESDDDEEIETPSSILSLTQTLTQADRQELLSKKAHIGMINGGNDCFFNATAQMILHSPRLSNYLIDKNNLMAANKSPNSKAFYDLWYELALTYQVAFQSKTPANYPRETMRQLLKLSKNRQEDASEALGGILGFYKDLPLLKLKKTNVLDLTQKELLSEKDKKKDPSQVDENGEMNYPAEFTAFLPINIPESDEINFDDVIKSSLTIEQEEDEPDGLIFSEGTEQYSINKYTSKTHYTCEEDEFFILVKRFVYNNTTKTFKKNRSALGIQTSHNFNEETYDLQGFVVHLPLGTANDENPNSGHYIAYCKTSAGWVKFNDQTKPEKIKDEDILEEANKGYILHFKKQVENDE